MISGNDGSGKSTYIKVHFKGSKSRHFYDSRIRRLIILFFVRKHKNTSGRLKRKNITSMPVFASIILLFYHFIKAISIGITSARVKNLVYDRGFVDECVSLSVLRGIRYNPNWLIIFYKLSGVENIIYLDADSRLKFERVVDKDIEWNLYLEKEDEYDRLISVLMEYGLNIQYIRNDE